jgi:hypothetical protein
MRWMTPPRSHPPVGVVPLLVGLAACVSAKPVGPDSPCPCAPGWVCNPDRDLCELPDTRHMVNRTPDPIPDRWPPSWAGNWKAVYDVARDRLVVFTYLDEQFGPRPPHLLLWEWDGTAWEDRSMTDAPDWPPSLGNEAVAYDSDRHVTVVSGDCATRYASRQIWEWDGRNFHKYEPPTAPCSRARPAMAYDPRARKTVLYGGLSCDNGAALADLWTWDGQVWTDLTPNPLPATWPSPRRETSLVWDTRRQRLVLFGGMDSALSVTSELWEWDGTRWFDLTPDPRPPRWPPPRTAHVAGYDPQRGVMLVFGGQLAEPPYGRDLWEWDSRALVFRNLTPASPPSSWPTGWSAAGAFEVARGRLALIGGGIGSGDVGLQMHRWLFEYGP